MRTTHFTVPVLLSLVSCSKGDDTPAGVALPSLLIGQAQFRTDSGRPVPGKAKLVILKTDGKEWVQETIEDPASNVFHKAMPWRGGILAIAGEKARLVKFEHGSSTPAVLWEREWGGKFNRLRDIEIADVTGDGKEDIVLATHDQGVVALGEEHDGSWSFREFDQAPDTFVHEIEIGDVDGDGALEIYASPSARNRASGESQPGDVVRYVYKEGTLVRSVIAHWDESHAKELLLTDTDKNGRPELYAVREAHTVKGADGSPQVQDPVRIVRLDPPTEGDAWQQTIVATLDDRQCRVLLAGDVDGDGAVELVAAGYKTGVYVLERNPDGTFQPTKIDADSSGFEHAAHLADLNKDGKLEIYVAADDQRAIRQYTWNGRSFDRVEIARIPENHITWNIQDAVW